jgi:RNA polymerase sigma-70 factor (ECF subfamily)
MVINGLRSPDAGLTRRSGEVYSERAVETDAELVTRLQRGDGAAAGQAYDRYVGNVQGLVYRLLGPEADFDDIVQEVFIYAFHSIDKLRDPAALRPWLLGIATGKVRAHLRRSRRRRWLSFLSHDELAELPVPAADPQVELLRDVYRILDCLPTDERLALIVRRVEGLPIHEAAEACGMSLSTFKRRYARAESRFLARAKQSPALARWLTGGPA